MSFNCLTCSKLKRVDSEREHKERCGVKKAHFKPFLCKNDRSWSGNLGHPRPYEKLRYGTESSSSSGMVARKRAKSIFSDLPLIIYEEDEQPRLLRSCGMRRDWSFEDLMINPRIRETNLENIQEKETQIIG